MKEELLALATKMLRAGSPAHAEELLQIYLKEYPLDFDAMILLAQTYLDQNRFDLAKRQIETCLLIPNLAEDQIDLLNNFEDQTFDAKRRCGEPRISPIGEDTSSDLGKFIEKTINEALENQTRPPAYLRDPGYEYMLSKRSSFAKQFDDRVFDEATAHPTWQDHVQTSFDKIGLAGLFLEFGVHKGLSINEIAKLKPEKTIHGFDSFEGFPERWHSNPAGTMSLDGIPPETLPNVELYKGWFKDTLPKFLENHRENVAFVHIDCDLYSSTMTVLQALETRIKPGTVLVFDDYLPDEITAFNEFVDQCRFTYEYVSYHLHDHNRRLSMPHSVSLVIL